MTANISLSINLCSLDLRRLLHCTTTAQSAFASTADNRSAVITEPLASASVDNGHSAMLFNVARPAQSQSIGNIKGEIGSIGPSLYMMGVQLFRCSASLACVIVSPDNRPAPLAVITAFMSCFSSVLKSTCTQVTAFFAAKLGVMSISLFELFSTPSACPHRSGIVDSATFFGASPTALIVTDKRFATHRTFNSPAIIADFLYRMADVKRFAAFLADAFDIVRRRNLRHSAPINVFATKSAVSVNHGSAIRMGAGLHFVRHSSAPYAAYCALKHPRMQILQRLSDMGLAPVKAEA